MRRSRVSAFTVNRPISTQDRKYQLNGVDHKLEPYADLVTIKMNSTYLEVVDRLYSDRGLISGVGILISTAWLLIPLWFWGKVVVGIEQDPFYAWTATVLSVPLLAVVAFGLSKELFAYTHYPIRLNRKTNAVHVFRLDGTVLSVPWNEVFFTLDYQQEVAGRAWEIRGHVLDADGVTVRETFGLGMQSSGDAEGLRALRSHWEFYRRYMEDGPQAVKHCVKVCMPVDGRREPFIAGSRCIFSHVDNLKAHPVGVILWIFMLPLNWLSVIGRWIAMQTSRIPKWPDEVEAVNVIEPGDPHVVDERINPPELRR